MYQNPQQQQKIQIKIPEAALHGVYSNLMYISHTKDEFVLDFINVQPPNGIVNARVITSPGHAKRVLKALEENIKKYEDRYGEIELPEPRQNEVGFNYQQNQNNDVKTANN